VKFFGAERAGVEGTPEQLTSKVLLRVQIATALETPIQVRRKHGRSARPLTGPSWLHGLAGGYDFATQFIDLSEGAVGLLTDLILAPLFTFAKSLASEIVASFPSLNGDASSKQISAAPPPLY
jgi:hypothetical protein